MDPPSFPQNDGTTISVTCLLTYLSVFGVVSAKGVAVQNVSSLLWNTFDFASFASIFGELKADFFFFGGGGCRERERVVVCVCVNMF